MIARADGRIDFLDAMQVEGEDYGFGAFMASVEALLIGRRTYDTALTFDEWPFASKRVWVATHRQLDGRFGEVGIAGDVSSMLEELANCGVRHVYLDGGELIRQALLVGAVDEMTLSVVPMILGSGRRLFDGTLPALKWQLLSSASFASGLAQLRYRS